MYKLIALYKTPENADVFLERYRSRHVPLVDKIPGLRKVEFTRISQTVLGEKGNFLLAEMYFSDAESFKTALKSPENAAAGADAMEFAAGILTVMTGEVIEL